MPNKNPIYTTAPGTLLYPHLSKPDTTFNVDGLFQTKIILEPNDETMTILKAIKATVTTAIQDALQKNPKLKLETIKRADMPYSKETDEDGNETGNYVFSVRMKPTVKTKTGATWEQSPDLFDSSNKTINRNSINPWTGTIARVSFEIIPFYTAQVGAGATLRLKAVQILKLIEGGHRSAEYYGFPPTEDGWTYSESEATDMARNISEDEDLPF